MKNVVIILILTVCSVSSFGQTFTQPNEVISSGAEISSAGNYSNFGVLGDSFVSHFSTDGNYTTYEGFLNSFQILVSIKIIENKFNSKIFPNPTTKFVFVEFSKIPLEYHFKLYNNLGQLIHQKRCENQLEKIDLENIPNGTYYLKIHDNKFSKTEKIIVK